MRASDSSVGGAAGQFRTRSCEVAMVSADGPGQSVSFALCDALIAAEGRTEAVKPESGGSVEEPGKESGSVHHEPRTCPVCGTKFATADTGFCPVCILHGAAAGEYAATSQPGSVSGSADSPGQTEEASQARRFENYEVMLGNDGKPIELGRGAMGITYKALDVDLRCPVTLKVISERYLGDEFQTTRSI